jgi:multicomponent Na+:H+ antiporter subunit D
MLAYSSVSQIGYVALGLGLGTPLGLVGALLHILNHACMKAGLFLVGGAIRLRAGTTEVGRFAGLGRSMPWTMAAFTVLALAMIGIPPTAGFFSKWYLVLGGIEAGHWLFVAVIVLSSLLTAVYFVRVIEQVYRGHAEEQDAAPAPRREAPVAMLGPILVLAGLVLVLGLGNAAIVTHLLQPVAAPLGGP